MLKDTPEGTAKDGYGASRRIKAACGHWISAWVEVEASVPVDLVLPAFEEAFAALAAGPCHACATRFDTGTVH